MSWHYYVDRPKKYKVFQWKGDIDEVPDWITVIDHHKLNNNLVIDSKEDRYKCHVVHPEQYIVFDENTSLFSVVDLKWICQNLQLDYNPAWDE